MNMNLKEEIYKTIIANCYTEEDKPEDSVIMGDDFYKLANDLTELVKKMGYIPCRKSDSEQLPSFLYKSGDGLYFKHREDTDVRNQWNEYLKTR